MKRLLVVFVGILLSQSMTVVAADTEGFIDRNNNSTTGPAFDQIFAQAKAQGGMTPLFFQRGMDGGGLEAILRQGLPAYGGQAHSGAQALVDRFFSEDFDPTAYTDLTEDEASGTEGEDNGDLPLPFFSAEEGDSEDQDSGGLDAWIVEEDWLWSRGAYGGDTWYAPRVWGDTQ